MIKAFTRRWLPMPAQSLILFAVWLLLNNTLAAGHILLGAILALGIPLLVSPMQSPQPRVRSHLRAVRYTLMVLYDILVANFEVAVRVIGPMGKLQPAFVAVPLDIEGAVPITILASTISLTPGTVSAEVSEDRRWLYIHVLHLTDEAQLIAQIKSRYEAPLKEIFRC